ncbi:MAG: hypothetical protein AB7E96_01645 [Deferribacterales bacterium]
MASSFTEKYSKFSVWMCKSPYVPSGICYPEKCVSSAVSVKSEKNDEPVAFSLNGADTDYFGFFEEKYSVKVYLLNDDDGEYIADLFLIPEDRDEMCLLSGLACTQIADPNADAPWQRTGNTITVKLPKIRACGLNSLKTIYSESKTSFKTISGLKAIESPLPQCIHNTGNYLLHETQLSDDSLIPGARIAVYYRMDGHDDYFSLGSFSFQTDIFTSAVLLGCGLVEKVKVYNNPARPQDGYEYVYTTIQGGVGSTLKEEWLYDERLRWCVSYYGEKYWLKSVFPCFIQNGTRVGILKSVTSLPMTADTDIDSGMVRTTLYETSDRIVPEYYYGG